MRKIRLIFANDLYSGLHSARFIENAEMKKKLKKSQRIVILICEYRALISWFALIGLVLNERSYNSENHDTLGAYVTIDSAAFYSEHVRWLRIGICCDFVFVTHRDFVAHRGSKTRQCCSLTRKIGGLKTHFSA